MTFLGNYLLWPIVSFLRQVDFHINSPYLSGVGKWGVCFPCGLHLASFVSFLLGSEPASVLPSLWIVEGQWEFTTPGSSDHAENPTRDVHWAPPSAGTGSTASTVYFSLVKNNAVLLGKEDVLSQRTFGSLQDLCRPGPGSHLFLSLLNLKGMKEEMVGSPFAF